MVLSRESIFQEPIGILWEEDSFRNSAYLPESIETIEFPRSAGPKAILELFAFTSQQTEG